MGAKANRTEGGVKMGRICIHGRTEKQKCKKCNEMMEGSLEVERIAALTARIKELEGEVIYWKQQFEGRGVV